MGTINDLNTTDELEDDDKFVIWDRQAGATRAITALNMADYFSLSGGPYQPLDELLTSIAALGPTTAADRMIYTTAQDTAALTPLTSFARTLLDDANAATALGTLGGQPVDATLTMYAALGIGNRQFVRGTGTDTGELVTLSAALTTFQQDDYSTLQLAINAAEVSGGKVVAKSGTTSVSATVVNDASRVWLEGQGIASVIEANSASITPVYRIGLAAGPGVTDNKLSSVKIGRSVASDAGSVGLEFGDWNNATVRDVVIAEHGYGILVNGPTGSVGIQLAFENCMLYDCRDAYVWIIGGAGVYFKGGEMGRNGVSESPQPRACIVVQGDSNDLRFEGMNVIPRRSGGSTTDVFSFESYTNSTGYIVLDDFNCESVRSVIKTDASTPLVNGLIATGCRLTCDDNFFNQNAATTFQNWLISNCNISCTGFTATFGQWNRIDAFIASNVTLTLKSTADFKFASRVTGNVSIAGGGTGSHLDLTGAVITGNLTLTGTFGTVTGNPLVLGTPTISGATITTNRLSTQSATSIPGTLTGETANFSTKLRGGTTADITVFGERMSIQNNALVASLYRTTSTGTDGLLEAYSDVGGTKTKTFQITANGNVTNTNNSYGAISDASLKQDVRAPSDYWDRFRAVNFVKYRLKSQVAADPDAASMLGVIAQELEAIFPGLIEETIDPAWLPDPESTESLQDQIAQAPRIKVVKTSILTMIGMTITQQLQDRVQALEAHLGIGK